MCNLLFFLFFRLHQVVLTPNYIFNGILIEYSYFELISAGDGEASLIFSTSPVLRSMGKPRAYFQARGFDRF